MKLDERAVVEILEIVRRGFAYGQDISQQLRDLDLEAGPSGKMGLTPEYLAGKAVEKVV